jgi:hypothetical protein
VQRLRKPPLARHLVAVQRDGDARLLMPREGREDVPHEVAVVASRDPFEDVAIELVVECGHGAFPSAASMPYSVGADDIRRGVATP